VGLGERPWGHRRFLASLTHLDAHVEDQIKELNVHKGELSYPSPPSTLLNTGVRDKHSHGDACSCIYWGEESTDESDGCEVLKKKLLSDYAEIKKTKPRSSLSPLSLIPLPPSRQCPGQSACIFLQGGSGELPGIWGVTSPGSTVASSGNCSHPALGKEICKQIRRGCLLPRKTRSRVKTAGGEAAPHGGWLGAGQGPEQTHEPHPR